jgi:hypothetical protein
MGNISVRGQPTKIETCIAFGILLVLAAIVVGIFIKQFHYNRAIIGKILEGDISAIPTTGLSAELLADMARGMVPMNPPEIFGPENLSDKINGRAELYLSAGFVSLVCQRLAEEGDPTSWMEVFVYDMGTARKAFAVYSMQRRPDGENSEVAEFAYRTENALFFAHGRYYVELIAAVTTEGMAGAMRSLAHNFVKRTGLYGERIEELALFPREGLDKDSITLLASDAFGFDRFDNVFMANYVWEDIQLAAFLSVRGGSSEASKLAAAYHAFLVENGGVDVKSDVGIPGAKVVKIFDTFELFFSHGKVLAGVHGAENRGQAERLAVGLMRRLSGADT